MALSTVEKYQGKRVSGIKLYFTQRDNLSIKELFDASVKPYGTKFFFDFGDTLLNILCRLSPLDR